MSDHPAAPTGLTLLEKLDMISWNLTREAAARIRELEAWVQELEREEKAWKELAVKMHRDIAAAAGMEPKL